jgi:CRISPR-associated protein Csd2
VIPGDLEMLWRAFSLMFEHDRAAGRGEMTLRGLYVFTHADAFGSAPAQTLFDRITITRTTDGKPPRSFSDYRVNVDAGGLPNGMTITPVVG